MTSYSKALIALGSNIDPRETYLEQALKLLESSVGKVLSVSNLMETAPVGGPPQGDFLNAACVVQTTLAPKELLEALLKIEKQTGRVRKTKWGPRTLDLDIILYEEEIWDEPGLTIPHPYTQERLFVLKPACEIAASWRHPVLQKTLEELRQELCQQLALKTEETSL